MRLRNIPRAPEVLAAHPLVIQNMSGCKGTWAGLFGNDCPLRVEIGTGKGRFLLSMAKSRPDVNFIGIERYSSVLLRAVEKADRYAREKGSAVDVVFPNVRFICADAMSMTDLFAPGEIDGLYLNFSDPWPKDRHSKRRLTSGRFLEVYRPLLRAGGTIEFKTDNRALFDFSLEELRMADGYETEVCTYDLHADPVLSEDNIMTEYEEKFSRKGNRICKLTARKFI